jgi:Na+/H+ antiporter NhaD/arsenite permease-like protein
VLPALIFVLTYAVLAIGNPPGFRIDRTGAALIGAILMVAVGGLPLDDAYRAIDYRTIVLLFGMMIIIASLRLAGFFRGFVRWMTTHIDDPVRLLVAVVFTSGLLSALFVNDTVCLVFAPILVEIARARGLPPLPYLLALATSSNIGSVATITGNPQNMLIGSLSQVSYAGFAAALGPVALVGLAVDAALIWWLFRRQLVAAERRQPERRPRVVHRSLLLKALIVSTLVLAGFLAGFDPAVVAASGAAVLLITRRVNPEKVYRLVDWDLLTLFIGLFVVVRGIEHAGLAERLFAWLQPIGVDRLVGLSLVSAALSNLISNVPAVMVFTSVVPRLPNPTESWLALAMSSTLAGNLTILGSIANLIVVERARAMGVTISFLDYLRVGLPITIATMAFGIWWLAHANAVY